jgi:hypothetical protein
LKLHHRSLIRLSNARPIEKLIIALQRRDQPHNTRHQDTANIPRLSAGGVAGDTRRRLARCGGGASGSRRRTDTICRGGGGGGRIRARGSSARSATNESKVRATPSRGSRGALTTTTKGRRRAISAVPIRRARSTGGTAAAPEVAGASVAARRTGVGAGVFRALLVGCTCGAVGTAASAECFGAHEIAAVAGAGAGGGIAAGAAAARALAIGGTGGAVRTTTAETVVACELAGGAGGGVAAAAASAASAGATWIAGAPVSGGAGVAVGAAASAVVVRALEVSRFAGADGGTASAFYLVSKGVRAMGCGDMYQLDSNHSRRR